MTEKELRRLKRVELLEIMLEQQKRIEALEEELKAAKEELESRRIAISKAGTLSEAALAVTRLFAEADRAAAIYLENLRRMAGVEETTPKEAETQPEEETIPAEEAVKMPDVKPETKPETGEEAVSSGERKRRELRQKRKKQQGK